MTLIDATGTIHRPGGTPAGGQFAGHVRTAPDGELTDELAGTHENPLARRFDSVEEKIRAMQDELADAVDGLADDEMWNRYLDTMALFHNYSFQNQMLIGIQRPDATRVAGFQTWKKAGRSVRKGEKGISILAPRLVNAEDDNGQVLLDESGRPKKRFVGVTSATVFDVAQTDGEDLPTAHVPLTEEPPAGFSDDLTAAIIAQGFTVSFEAIPGGAYGYTSKAGGVKRVVIDEKLSEGERATTLAHELGHIMCGHLEEERDGEYHTGHGGKRGEMEVEAESFAYTLARINGMKTHKRNASEYVAGWQRHEPEAIRKVGDTLSRAVKAAMTGSAWRNAAA